MGRRERRTAAGAGLIALAGSLVIGCSPQEQGSSSADSRSAADSLPAASSSGPGVSRSTGPTGRSGPASPAGSASTGSRTTPTGALVFSPVPRASVALPTGVATEASGLTPAGTADGVFWTVDDGAGTDALVAIDESGRQVGLLQVEGMTASNAEALSSARCTTGSTARCLFVGDLGDHVGREDVTIYRVPEPDVVAGSHHAAGTAWRYTYADGPRNAEAFFVAADGTLVVLDKPQRSADGSMREHHVYRGAPGGGVLALVGTFAPPAPTQPLQSILEGNVVTDAALQVGARRTRVLVQFYDQVLQYTAPERSSDPALFFRWPHVALEDPELIQAEGVAPLPDGCGFAAISEAGPGGRVAGLSIAPCR